MNENMDDSKLNDFDEAEESFDTLPEVDDSFESDDAFENHFEDEFLDDGFDDLSDIDYSKPQEKSGINWFNIGIIGFAVVGVVGLSYNFLPEMFSGGQGQPQKPMTQQTSQPQNQQLAQQALTDQGNNTPEVSFFDNPELLNNDINDAPIQSDEVLQTIEQLDSIPSLSDQDMEDIFAAIPQGEVKLPNAPEVIEFEELNTLPMPSDADVTPIDTPEDLGVIEQTVLPIAPSISDETVVITSNNEIDAINARIDDMNQSMETFMERLDARLETMSAPTQQTGTADNSDEFNQLQKTLSRLENRIDAIESKPDPIPTLAPVVTMKEQPKPKVVIEEKARDVLLPTPEPTRTVKRPANREPAYVPPKIIYELRGVSDGQAVIAAKGTQNLKTVNVGTVVRGLGTIRSIAVENGQWVVRGTNGTVRQ